MLHCLSEIYANMVNIAWSTLMSWCVFGKNVVHQMHLYYINIYRAITYLVHISQGNGKLSEAERHKIIYFALDLLHISYSCLC